MSDEDVLLSPEGLFFPMEMVNTGRGIENVLILRNTAQLSNTPAAGGGTRKDGFYIFRIRANRPDNYAVRPRMGLLYPDSVRAIRIGLKPLTEEELADAASGAKKHCFQIDVRRVANERALNTTINLLSDSTSADKKANEALKDLFDRSSGEPVRSWTLTCAFNGINYAQTLDGEKPSSTATHAGVVVDTTGLSRTEYPATIVMSSTAGSRQASVANRGGTPSMVRGASLEEAAVSTPGGDSTAPSPQDTLHIHRLEEQIEEKRAEEARLKAELMALTAQTSQLQADCDAVLQASQRNNKKLEQLEKDSLQRRKRYGGIQWVSMPVPVMMLLICATFVLALVFRPLNSRV